MAVAETGSTDHHDHDEHHLGEFIAHHFDSAEQQFDSGKLGIWVFLVTEVLFFSGLFVAYILWRYHHPQIFEQAHVFLDKYLGALNTIVLLFSSLTIAWAVRSAQLGKNKLCATLTLITMICAAMFLGVKAIEYSHKWDEGILVRSAFAYTLEHTAPTMPLARSLGISDYLVGLSIAPAILLAVFLGLAITMKLIGKDVWFKFCMGLVATVGGYFLGAVGGSIYMEAKANADAKKYGSSHAQVEEQPLVLLAQEQEPAKAETQKPAGKEEAHAQGEHAGDAKDAAHAATDEHADHDHSADADGHSSDHEAHQARPLDPHKPRPEDLDRDVGIFFSIYYCMTGLHAIHIFGGILALSWIFYRSLAGHWRPDYFGPVDYVGLYWHLVDLIWIYLFPMLYLID